MQTEISQKLSANCSKQIYFGTNELTNSKYRRRIVCVLSHIFFDCVSGNRQETVLYTSQIKIQTKMHANTYSDVSLLSKRSWWPFFMQMEHVWDILHQKKDAAALCNRRKLQQSSNVKTFASNFTIQILLADSASRAGCIRQNLENQ